MTYRDLIKELKGLGTAQARKVYKNHGVIGPAFGISYAHLTRLKKNIRVDHDLAIKLWENGNHDARILATMIADPEALDNKTAEAWAKDLDNYVTTGALSGLVGRSSLAQKKMEKWVKARGEWISAAGWNIASSMAMHNTELPDTYFAELLKTIEASIHNSKNRTRYSMNNALIAIGARNSNLEKKAIAAAKRIGVVEVDHGMTGCKTPDAIPYMKKMIAHKHKMKK